MVPFARLIPRFRKQLSAAWRIGGRCPSGTARAQTAPRPTPRPSRRSCRPSRSRRPRLVGCLASGYSSRNGQMSRAPSRPHGSANLRRTTLEITCCSVTWPAFGPAASSSRIRRSISAGDWLGPVFAITLIVVHGNRRLERFSGSATKCGTPTNTMRSSTGPLRLFCHPPLATSRLGHLAEHGIGRPFLTYSVSRNTLPTWSAGPGQRQYLERLIEAPPARFELAHPAPEAVELY